MGSVPTRTKSSGPHNVLARIARLTLGLTLTFGVDSNPPNSCFNPSNG